jgi:hydrogenase nickel incorporation protein HypA/HybF
MHELSMAEAIVETVLDVAKKNDAQEIVEVTIEVENLPCSIQSRLDSY